MDVRTVGERIWGLAATLPVRVRGGLNREISVNHTEGSFEGALREEEPSEIGLQLFASAGKDRVAGLEAGLSVERVHSVPIDAAPYAKCVVDLH